LTKMQSRLANVSPKKQKTTSNADESGNTKSRGSHDAPMLDGTTQETEPDRLQSGEINEEGGTHVGVESIEDKNTVTVKELFEGMLSKQRVRVKIFYVPAATNRVPRQYGIKTEIDIFETTVGCSGHEYILIAFGPNATQTLNLLRDCTGCVVEIAPVRHNNFKGTDQIEVQDNMEITVLSTKFESLRRQVLSTITMSIAANLKDRSRVHFTPVKVKERFDLRHDKNGRPYRTGKFVDASGFVCDLMVWGILATREELFEEGAIVEFRNVTVNKEGRKFETKEGSAAYLAPDKTFEVPRRLQMVEWQ